MQKRKLWILFSLCAVLLTACHSKLPDAPEPKAVTSKSDTCERTDYVDESGNPSVSPQKGYAGCVRSLDENGRNILESYYDAEGKPIRLKAGYHAIARQYNALGQCERITYLNERNAPVNTTSGYAVILRSYNKAGRIEYQFYLNADDSPATEWSGAYGYRREYNASGQVTAIHYLDSRGNPTLTNMGYAIVRRSYASAQVYTEFYYAIDGTPTGADLGQYGVNIELDSAGHAISRTFLDIDGNIATLSAGYSILRTAYNEQGTKVMDTYFDADGNPIRVFGRYHGISYENGKKTYFDETGKPVFLLDRFLHGHPGIVIAVGAGLCIAAVFLPECFRAVLLGLYLAFIGFMTLMYRGSGDSRARLTLFWSYRRFFQNSTLRREVINNILLFVPFGALLRSLTARKRVWVLIPLLTIAIELTQYFTKLGLCEADDIVSNTIGGLLGYGVVCIAYRFKKTD